MLFACCFYGAIQRLISLAFLQNVVPYPMPWNPEVYKKYESDRFAPFFDLFAMIEIRPGLEVIDLGCGTGEMTKELAQQLPSSTVVGIDASPEMLSHAANFSNNNLRFECITIQEQLATGKKWDIVFSNAALQWVSDHETIFPQLLSIVKPAGQLLIQMPAQHHNIGNRLIADLAAEEPFTTVLKGWKRPSPVLALDEYAKLFFNAGCKDMKLYEKIYPLVVKDADALLEWLQGSTLTPYAERMTGIIWSSFITELKKRLHESFPTSPAFYPFRRMLMEVGKGEK